MQRFNFGFALLLLFVSKTALGSVLTNGVDGINVPAGARCWKRQCDN